MQKTVFLLPLFITSCFLSDSIIKNIKPKLEQAIMHNDKSKKHLEEKEDEHEKLIKEDATFEILEGTTEKCMCPICSWLWCGCPPKCQITWMKIKAKEIIGDNQKPLEALKGKLRYSYSVSPIKYNDKYSKYVMPLILFESMDENIEVTSFKLINHTNLDFNNKNVLGGIIQGIPKVEKSSEEGYKNVYPYGILNALNPTGGDELISAFAALYQNGKWNLMEGEIKVKDTKTNTETTHKILLSGKLFNEFIKTVVSKHQGTTTANTKFRVPINSN
ncbi:p23 cell envelope protein (plasmid) [Borrelia turicatae]|uniref:p23 cell envelope protein n=1 Tax=Borrelia turicatae TaxID=142 RepID=A0A172XCI2_BORTU|nr:S2/P23 family protein [Borrelia turicatae]ANF34395.1 p23 cell envelope protein [Borrelia turicatae]UPA15472.1 S2/P23 family protein [Borrelia turicatae]